MSAPTDLQRFATNLRTVRKKRGMSQMDLGRACDLHPTAIARIETAKREPRIGTAIKLARALGVPTAELFRGL